MAIAQSTATAIGTATAKAMTEANAEVDVEGQGSSSAIADSSAEAIASVVATAIADAFAKAVGPDTQAAATASSEVSSEAIAVAVASARAEANSQGGSAEASSEVVSTAVAEVVVTAIAEALASVNDGNSEATAETNAEAEQASNGGNGDVPEDDSSQNVGGVEDVVIDMPGSLSTTTGASENDVGLGPLTITSEPNENDNEDDSSQSGSSTTTGASENGDGLGPLIISSEPSENDDENDRSQSVSEGEDFVDEGSGSQSTTTGSTENDDEGLAPLTITSEPSENDKDNVIGECSQNINWGFDYFGFDLPVDQYKNGPKNVQPTVEACCASCMEIDECIAFSWNMESGHCWLKYSAWELVENKSVATKKVREGPIIERGPCASGFFEKVDFAHGDIPGDRFPNGPFNKQTNAAMCCASCLGVEGCVAFTWHEDTSDCWLKDSITGEVWPSTTATSKVVRF